MALAAFVLRNVLSSVSKRVRDLLPLLLVLGFTSAASWDIHLIWLISTVQAYTSQEKEPNERVERALFIVKGGCHYSKGCHLRQLLAILLMLRIYIQVPISDDFMLQCCGVGKANSSGSAAVQV